MRHTPLILASLASAIALLFVPGRVDAADSIKCNLAWDAASAKPSRAGYQNFLNICGGHSRARDARAWIADHTSPPPRPPTPSSVESPAGLLYRNMIALPNEKWRLLGCRLARSYDYREVNDAYFAIDSAERENRRPNAFNFLIRAPWGTQQPRGIRFTAVLLRSGRVIRTYPTTTSHVSSGLGQSNWVNFEWQVSRDELGRLSGERVDQAQIRFNGQKLITLRDVSMKSTGVLLGEGCKLSNDPAGYEIKPVD